MLDNKTNSQKSAGETIRRKVMGDDFVDSALAKATDLTQPMQEFINDHGWGSTWQRPGLDLKTRSLVTIAMLAALKAPQELKGHIRGALNNGASIEEIQEVLLHSAVYCGAPAAQEAFRAAQEVLINE
ncbi:MAG: carboxymuconolactone decarboxylase family protein [Colwellia sp.]|uniref:carboxymuconolactone decarboxylase family protein n=1 Tax=Colwellia sp. TaxID=56799 RepID=UPI0025BAA805|nr:carboxymuconolactone decarboxylase family protein [Colwellia sp.]MCJ8295107.1 carboxymuconolactone decarboxylase family protein [Colwellia sp.]NQZ28620.1 carboxymuconolactone decarboxylase family protein [Colwellia sp.]